MPGSDASLLGQGLHWQALRVGQRFRSYGRTVTEHDLMGFVALAGMQEPLFLDATHGGPLVGRAGARPVPGALTYALAEGLVLRMVHGTGLAMLESTLRPLAPVHVGDTLRAEVEVTAIRPTSKGNRAVVESAVRVLNQHGATVMEYGVKRLLAGEPQQGEDA
jgi:acyl dehydratase